MLLHAVGDLHLPPPGKEATTYALRVRGIRDPIMGGTVS